MGRAPWARIYRLCPVCGKTYWTTPSRERSGRDQTCSMACNGARTVVTPPSERIERVRAAGYVNHLIRDGRLTRPDRCQQCAKVGRVDAHHENYAEKDKVEFLCRSCHMKRHHRPRAIPA